jgi:hypothetical protein
MILQQTAYARPITVCQNRMMKSADSAGLLSRVDGQHAKLDFKIWKNSSEP